MEVKYFHSWWGGEGYSGRVGDIFLKGSFFVFVQTILRKTPHFFLINFVKKKEEIKQNLMGGLGGGGKYLFLIWFTFFFLQFYQKMVPFFFVICVLPQYSLKNGSCIFLSSFII